MITLFTDDFKAQPYWWDRSPRPQIAEQSLPGKVDVAIVGSGYTGLNAAIQTARGGRSTLVLDAQTAGWGCSSRNGGHVSNSLKPDYHKLARRVGANTARGVLEEGMKSVEYMHRLINDEQLDCEWTRCGRFIGAHNRQQLKRMKQKQQGYIPGLSQPYHIIEPEHTHEEIGTAFYHGGCVVPDVCSLDAGKYSLELLRLARQAGAGVVSNCEVTEISKNGEGFDLSTGLGTVKARDVIVATNGYSGSLMSWLKQRVIPIGSYIIATEPLTSELMDELLPTRRVIVDTRSLVYYYRACPEGKRILFGGRVALSEGDPVKSAPVLHRHMCDIFPQLETTRISHAWMGYVAYTFDTLPHMGTRDGVHYSMGYCGSGVGLSSYFGMKLGRRVLGDPAGETPLSGIDFQTRPLYTGNPWFLSPSILYYQLKDRLPI